MKVTLFDVQSCESGQKWSSYNHRHHEIVVVQLLNSLQPHGLQHARLPCPSPSLRACSVPCPLSQWCHPAIRPSSVIPFFCHQSSQHQGLLSYKRPWCAMTYWTTIFAFPTHPTDGIAQDVIFCVWLSLSMTQFRSSCVFLCRKSVYYRADAHCFSLFICSLV